MLWVVKFANVENAEIVKTKNDAKSPLAFSVVAVFLP